MSFWPTTQTYYAQLLAYFITGDLLVTITSPTEAQVVATAALPVSWTCAPGTQQTARVRVWSDLALTDPPVYDSGVVPQAAQAFTIPEGMLQTATTYYLRVDVTMTSGTYGGSATRTFSTAFAPVNPLAAPTLTLLGDCPTPADQELPGVIVHLAQAVLGANEVFIRYSVWRRPRDGSTDAWTRIASVTAIGTRTYFDPELGLNMVYEYDNTFTVSNTVTGNVLTSAMHAAPPSAYITNPWTYLQNVDDATEFCTFYHFAGDIEPVDDIAETQFWGNQRAVVFVGSTAYDHIKLPGLPDVKRGKVWDRLQELRAAQRTEGAVLMLRIGEQGKRYYCALARAASALDQGQYTPSIDLIEVQHDEAVA